MKHRVMDVFSTGRVAKICRVAPRTVATWFDKGLIKGFLIPGSQDRRVPRRDLIRFMIDRNIPLYWLEEYDMNELPRTPEERIKWMKEMIEKAPTDKKAESFLRGFIESVSQNPECPVQVIADMARIIYAMRNKQLEEWNKKKENEAKG